MARHRHERNICRYWDHDPRRFKELDQREIAIAVAALEGESWGTEVAQRDFEAKKK